MSKLVPLAALMATLCVPLLAHADVATNGAPGMTAPLTAPANLTASSAAPKSESTALSLSLGGTAASAALVIAGGAANNGGMVTAGLLSSLVTPSLGEWYTGKVVTAGMGIRVVSAAATVVGVSESLKCLDWGDSTHSCSSPDSAAFLLVGGLAGYASGVIYDVATAPREARRYNERHALTLAIAPAPLRTPSGQSTMGLGIGGTF